MTTWETLKRTLEAAGPPGSKLDELASQNLASRATAEVRTLGTGLPREVPQSLSALFLFAAEQLRSGLEHDFFGELIRLAGELGNAGHHVPDALDFLQSALEHRPRTSNAAALQSRAIDSLICCLNPQRPDLAEAAIIAFGIAISCVQAQERHRLLAAAEALPAETTRRPLLPSLRRYHERLSRLEQAGLENPLQATDPFSVVSIHSHKGGVGKTTVAIAIGIALARGTPSRNPRRVCVVDCDDEGPSLHFYLPVDASRQPNVLFFCDWFCSEDRQLPDGLLQNVEGPHCLSFVAGSFLGTDLTSIDEHVSSLRQRTGPQSPVESRILELIHLLRADFDSIVLDTSPGLNRLSLEVLAASIRVAGSRIFVMRPRPIDIALLCVEEDWIVAIPSLPGSNAVVLNFSAAEAGDNEVDLTDAAALASELTNWPQFSAYAKRFAGADISGPIQAMVRRVWPQFHSETMRFSSVLGRAGNIRGPSPFAEIGSSSAAIEDAEKILSALQQGYSRGTK